MAVSGFEGFEKRLELHFSGDDPATAMAGLRLLDFESLEAVLHAVQCTVVAAVGNRFFDSYVLSESSLFVYPTKIIIKTCGTTQLLKSVRPMIQLAGNIGLRLSECRYTRGNFIFPKAQPFPHSSFQEEVFYLEEELPGNLCYRKASIMPSKMSSHSWHVFSARDRRPAILNGEDNDGLYTVEICMTELDPVLARKFFAEPDTLGKDMTDATGIRYINPNAVAVCDFAFHPCGYSMNGVDGDSYSTIHVTPEDGFSYASYECVGGSDNAVDDLHRVLTKVVQVFRPGKMSVALTCNGNNAGAWKRVAAKAVEALGMKCRSCAVDEFPATAGTVTFQTFTPRRK